MSAPDAPVFRVSELVYGVRELLGEVLGEFGVEGELGAVHRSRLGHLYFDLRESGADEARLSAVLFQSAARDLEFEPREGMQVRVRASFDLYPPQGRLQLRVRSMRPAGEGARRRALEQLRERLAAEGLFDPGRKRALPYWPRGLGVVTSVRGAALHDFLRAARRRMVPELILVCDARVQGEGAWRELVRGLHWLDADPRVEVIVLTRGGGSAEDLWAFNREELVRAIAELRTPVVSAVGHEVDAVLTDLAADARASTPTAAAALCLPDREPLERRLHTAAQRLRGVQQARLRELAERLRGARRALVHPARRLRGLSERLEALSQRLGAAGARSQRARQQRLGAASARLDALSPLRVLGRGYSIVFREADGRAVRSGEELSPGDGLRLRFARGGARARVESAEGGDEQRSAPAAAAPVGGGQRGGGAGERG